MSGKNTDIFHLVFCPFSLWLGKIIEKHTIMEGEVWCTFNNGVAKTKRIYVSFPVNPFVQYLQPFNKEKS